MSKLAVLLLAAGSSSRMGVPKQLLKWKDTNLLQHAINAVNELNSDYAFVVLGANYNKIIEQIDKKFTTLLYNPNWEIGLGNTIAFGVKKIKELHTDVESILIVLSDQPLVNSSYLKTIIKKHNLNHHKIVCTLYENNKLGVPAIFDKGYFEELSQLNHDRGAKNLLEKYSDNVVSIDGSHVISDIDSKEDYEVLFKKYH